MKIIDLEEAEKILEEDYSLIIDMDKHDSELLDKVLERVKEHHYLLSDQINSTDYGMFTVGIEQVIAEMKAEVTENE